MIQEYENARPLNLQQWSERLEVDAVVDAIFEECRTLGDIVRERNQRTCLKVVLLNLYVCYKSDPTRYIRYSRSHRTWKQRYNRLGLSPDQLRHVVDWLIELRYVESLPPKNAKAKEERRQSRMRATRKLIERFGEFQVSPLMIVRHNDAETIILKDAKKKLIEYEDTDETRRMREELKIINDLLAKTLINLYLSDQDLGKLNDRMRTGEIEATDLHPEDVTEDLEATDEEPRGAMDFTLKVLRRVFNNGRFDQGGRLYGGFWQSLPRESRKFLRINHMNTVEEDFSSMHINLIYWRKELPVPDGDLYTLAGFPEGTRKVVKTCLLTMINAKPRSKAMGSINARIRGYKFVTKNIGWEKKSVKKIIPKKDRIILPPGVKIEEVIKAFEKKHEAISDWFFSGKGRELQFWDSVVAVRILLKLAAEGVPCLPVHDSFIVSEPNVRGLRHVMSEAFFEVTGRYPKMDTKPRMTEENKKRGKNRKEAKATMEGHFQWKIDDRGRFREEFRREFSVYVGSIEEWRKVTGRINIFTYSKIKMFNKEI